MNEKVFEVKIFLGIKARDKKHAQEVALRLGEMIADAKDTLDDPEQLDYCIVDSLVGIEELE